VCNIFICPVGGAHVGVRLPGQRRGRHPRRLPDAPAEPHRGHEDQGHDPGVPHGRRGDAAGPHRALPQPGGQGLQRGVKGEEKKLYPSLPGQHLPGLALGFEWP